MTCFTRMTRVAKNTKSLLEAIVKEFNMSRKQDDFVFCGRRVRVTPEALLVSQEFAASSLVRWNCVEHTTNTENIAVCPEALIVSLIPCSDGIVWNPAIS